QAEWFFHRMLIYWPVLTTGLLFFAGSAWAVFGRRYGIARVFSAGEVVILILGWALAQHPFMVYPDLTFINAAGPLPTIRFLVISVPCGRLVLIPALWYLFKVFKTRPQAMA